MKFILSSFFLFVLAPCNAPKNVVNSKAEVDNSKVVITYHQSPCFGKCPVFTMTINGANKTIIYSGQSNVSKIGKFTKSIENDSITKLVEAFDNAHFFDLNDKYLGNIVDFPSTTISFTDKDRTKTVEERAVAPKELKVIEKLLSEIANSEGWKKEEEEAEH